MSGCSKGVVAHGLVRPHYVKDLLEPGGGARTAWGSRPHTKADLANELQLLAVFRGAGVSVLGFRCWDFHWPKSRSGLLMMLPTSSSVHEMRLARGIRGAVHEMRCSCVRWAGYKTSCVDCSAQPILAGAACSLHACTAGAEDHACVNAHLPNSRGLLLCRQRCARLVCTVPCM